MTPLLNPKMEEYGITEALAYDKHFEQVGFMALLPD
jgi:uncharacterized protein